MVVSPERRRAMLSAAALADIRAVLSAAEHGQRGRVVRALAARYGVSVSTIYQRAEVAGSKRPRAGKVEYRQWVRVAVALSHRAPQPIPLDLVMEGAVAAGLLPAQAAAMPLGTVHRIVRELGLRPGPRRTQKMAADYPMQALQMDASTSKFLVVDGALDDGDYQLKLHRQPTPSSGYKNKPLGADRLRVVTYGIRDLCTGYSRAVYRVAQGESAVDAIAALVEMLTATGDPARPLQGLPDDLWSDQGPLFKSAVSQDLLNRLGMALVVGEAYRKERMGLVERGWRTLWSRLETPLFLRDEDTITLSAMNARCVEYERRENALRASRTPVAGRRVSRACAWVALTNARAADNRLVTLPDNALQTLHREAERVIDRSGIVRWEGREYECLEWHNKRVLVRQSLAASDTLTLVDLIGGERSTARLYAPRDYGQVRGIAATSLDKLLQDKTINDAIAGTAADPYAPNRSPRVGAGCASAQLAGPAAPGDGCHGGGHGGGEPTGDPRPGAPGAGWAGATGRNPDGSPAGGPER